MTREESKSCIGTIEMLQRLAYNIHGVMDVIDADNCKKIIKALEQEPCDDAISRQAVLDLLGQLKEKYLAIYMALEVGIKWLPSVKPAEKVEQCEPCEDCVSRRAVLYAIANDKLDYKALYEYTKQLPPVTAEKPNKWIPVSERLPENSRFVNCTCHSLIDDREDWVVETVYIPQPVGSPYSDWGNIVMLNDGDCEVIAWMYRDIPEPYKQEVKE